MKSIKTRKLRTRYLNQRIRSKKADLSLSVNAIVVVILAITMLGLGLAFIRYIFKSATNQFDVTNEQVITQMKEQMKDLDRGIKISATDINIKAGQTKNIYIAYKNSDPTKSIVYKICSSEDSCSSEKIIDLASNDYCINLDSNDNSNCDGISVNTVPNVKVPANNVVIKTIKIKAQNTAQGTYEISFVVKDDSDNGFTSSQQITINVI